MRALRMSQPGDASVLSLDEVPTPEPGEGEVRVRLTHRPINPADIFVVAGVYPLQPAALPGIPGLEGMGTIDAVGPGVAGWSVGQRVVPMANKLGCWAEQIVVRQDQLQAVPDDVDDRAAAQFAINPLTAWGMLTDALPLQPGDWVLHTGASSALGKMAIQIARHRGYHLINLVRRPELVDEMLALGGEVCLSTTDEDWPAQVAEVTGEKGLSGAMDAVAGTLGAQVLTLLRTGGTMLTYGIMSLEFTSPVNTPDMLFRDLRLKGFWVTTWLGNMTPEVRRQRTDEVMRLIGDGTITMPAVEAEYDLADHQKAMAHAQQAGRHGKILLVG